MAVREITASLLHHKNEIISKRRVSEVFSNNPERSRLRGRPRNWWLNCVQTNIIKCKIANLKERSRNRTDWEKSIKEAKVRTGLCRQKTSHSISLSYHLSPKGPIIISTQKTIITIHADLY